MGNRVFVAAVVALWAGSMGWLVVDKVLPSYYGGPPSATGGFESGVPVGWTVEWAGRKVGTACSVRKPGNAGTGTTEIRNQIILHNLPLAELAPAWMRTVVGDIGDLHFNARTILVFDSLNSFSSFKSNIEINDIPDVLMMSGSMSGAFLELKIRSGDLSYPASIPIANGSALSEALFPDAKLPFMYIGRKWYEDLYHPFHSPSEPVETIEAEVVSEETINVGADTQRVFRVEYRGEARPGIPEEARLQAVAWVEPKSGDVLRQDVHVGQSKLRFTRVDEDEAREMADRMLASERRGWKSRWMQDRGLLPDGGRSQWPRRSGDPTPRGGHPRSAAPVEPPIPAAH